MNETTINPEINPEIDKLNKLAEVIEKHNSSLSPMGLSMRGIAASIAKDAKGENFSIEDSADAQGEAITNAHMETTNLITRYDEFLNKYGLKLLPQSSDRDDGVNTGQIMLTIVNAELFARKVNRLLRTGESETQSDFVRTAVKGYEKQIMLTHGDASDEVSRGIISSLPNMYTDLEPLSDHVDLSRLKAYAIAAKREELSEYITVDNLGLWQKPGDGFGPADWVKDIVPKELDKKWEKAIEILKTLPPNSVVYSDLQNHLIKCITHAHSLVDTLDYPDTYPREELKAVLKKHTPVLVGNQIN